jgi:SIR2-like domain
MAPRQPEPESSALSHIRKSAAAGKLIAVIGTGVSIALTNGKNRGLSWKGLVENGFDYGVQKGKITELQQQFWRNQLDSTDIDDLLSAAEFVGRKLGAPSGDLYARWLKNVFQEVKHESVGMANAIRALNGAGVPICTLNYDLLLEQVTGLGGITFQETPKVASWMRREVQGILHLHGAWDIPETCVLGIRDYEATMSDEVRDLIQRNLSTFNHLLFIGCGDTFADPNFSTLIKWLREKIKVAAPQHHALVLAEEVPKRHADTTWQGFVEPISYGADHRDLPEFLLREFPTKTSSPAKRKSAGPRHSATKAKNEEVLSDYRSFLLRDCGHMTIEGMRADMDTAQRKFDLERLFVPMKVAAIPPDFSLSDPERDQKLIKWQEKNKNPVPFGGVFQKHRRIALLALPGGGKTLLLKRLAVAYADPSRRNSSSDALPELELTPVLIRCREWREYIQRPIPSLLQNFAAITGQKSLTDLYDALVPLLKKGNVLLLIDGLDEIHNDGDRATFVDHLEAFIAEHQSIRVVVTSREAGFGLVAGPISRFCRRWRTAPLEEDAVRGLCDHWHRLMTGDTPESLAESHTVADRLLGNSALSRLAENPLLLTMLLVVKHGAGRLPPDRVSLYDRAIEVLLDTWNIKGHDALNLKEAVPQLACAAFELMRLGRQTATEQQLLAILEEAREKLPQIRRYAKDTPHDFLKRVELRSSLLVEAGHQLEGAKTVPFYQFRHLTFQEHLAAVAAAEGHYIGYQKEDTVLTPLSSHLSSEEWKEVIPMAAVLARKQSEPLLSALLSQANDLRQNLLNGREFPGFQEWKAGKMPAPVSRLIQALAEEAEASPETLAGALEIIALFARGCRSQENWQQLSSGPYGNDLLHQSWLLYSKMDSPEEAWVRNTVAALAVFRRPFSYWASIEAREELKASLKSDVIESVDRSLLTIAGFYWAPAMWRMLRPSTEETAVTGNWIPIDELERHAFKDEPSTSQAAIWAWALTRKDPERRPVDADPPNILFLEHLLGRWLFNEHSGIVAFAISTLAGMRRDAWSPKLSEDQKKFVRKMGQRKADLAERNSNQVVALIVGFHSKDVWPEEELAERLLSLESLRYPRVHRRHIDLMLRQFSAGVEILKTTKQRDDRIAVP